MLPLSALPDLDNLIELTQEGDQGAAVDMLKIIMPALPPILVGRVAELIVRIEGEHAELGTGRDTPRLR